jgi:hypothetical protein
MVRRGNLERVVQNGAEGTSDLSSSSYVVWVRAAIAAAHRYLPLVR